MIIGGMMIAGGALTAVGAITGNKKLMKIGGVLGLAGGVASLASNAWSSVASEVASGAAAGAAEGGALLGDATFTQMVGDVGGVGGLGGEFSAAALGDSVGSFAGSATGALGGAPAALGGLDASALAGQAPGAGLGGVASPDAVTGLLGRNSFAPSAATTTIPDVAGQAATTTTAATAAQPAAVAEVASTGAAEAGGSAIQKALKWAQDGNNSRLVQAGSGLLSAGLGAVGQQEAIKDQIKLQEQALQRSRDRLNASVKGLRVPTYKSATPAPKG